MGECNRHVRVCHVSEAGAPLRSGGMARTGVTCVYTRQIGLIRLLSGRMSASRTTLSLNSAVKDLRRLVGGSASVGTRGGEAVSDVCPPPL